MHLTDFLIHENNGSPKFWAKMSDGSCIFGSMVRPGYNTSENAGDVFAKERKGYVSINLRSTNCTQQDVYDIADMSTGRKVAASAKAGEVIDSIVSKAARDGLDLSRTHLPSIVTGAPPADTPPKEKPKPKREIEIFTKDFDPNTAPYSF